MAKTTVPQAHAERQILTPFGLIGSFDAEPLEHDSFEGSLERTAQTPRIAHLMLSGYRRLKTPSSQHGAYLDLIEYVPWSNSLCLRRPIELHNAGVPRPAPTPAPKPKPKPEPEPEPVPAGITDRLEHLRKRVSKQKGARESDCYLEESLLHRLEAEDWSRGGAGSAR